MRLVIDDGSVTLDVDVVILDPEATVADLARALTSLEAPAPCLVVDGRALAPDQRLDRAGIVPGSVVHLGTPQPNRKAPGRRAPRSVVAAIEVVGGLDAGDVLPLATGSWVVGRRRPTCPVGDRNVSAAHARIDVDADATVTVTDLGSRNGTWVDERSVAGPTTVAPGALVRLGASQFIVGPADDERALAARPWHRFAATGAIAFNRPPRPTPPFEHEPIDAPRPPAPVEGATPVGVVAVIAPLVLGLVMVQLFHNWMYAMFALLSPVMLLGGAMESRRRGRTAGRRDRQRFQHDLDSFVAQLAALATAERATRGERLPAAPEIVRRATKANAQLWERRPHHGDFLVLRLGLGAVPWEPPVLGEHRGMHPAVRSAVATASRLAHAPVEADLSGGGVVGIFGPRTPALALARSLVVQAATVHGPADVGIAILTTTEGETAWDWAKWLPHVVDRSGSGRRLLAAGGETADQLLRSLLDRAAGAPDQARGSGRHPVGPTLLVVLDDPSLTNGRRSPARSLLRGSAGPVAGIVIADVEEHLPAVCSTVVELVGDDGKAAVHRPHRGDRIDDVLIGGLSTERARGVARALARFEDPELDVAGAGLPATVSVLPLLGLDRPTAAAISARWERAGDDPDLIAPIGVAEDGVLAVDLVRDGPHALVAGTTGAGKSELLRSLVVGLAVSCSPDHLTFVLIDFKGGSAFDECSRLPHTVGMVTDLDEHLGERALRCLEAELRHRERRLRSAGATDLTDHRRLVGPSDPLPRLVVVIDEFATLAKELPDFVESLVGVAQRGRSLGVHLVLATQRPSGAVSENIRANTNLRIALRVQDANDSQDIIDRPDAAAISRDRPGRALVRLGPAEVVALQTALSTGVATPDGRPPVEVRPFTFGPDTGGPPTGEPDPPPPAATGLLPAGGAEPPPASELSLLVDAMSEAFRSSGRPPPRRPWPDPLPADLTLDDVLRCAADPIEAARDRSPGSFGRPAGTVAFAMADLPDRQAQRPTGWVPADGNLLLVGIGGSGTTTALAAIALSVAASNHPDDVHLYVLDFGAGELASLADLPHTGAVISADERERQQRLVRHLKAELTRRRALRDPRGSEPHLVVLLDGVAGFRAAWDETDPVGMADDLGRLFADGPDVGIHVVVTADRAGATPPQILGLARQRFVFRLGDDLDYGIFGVNRRAAPAFTAGGAVIAESSTVVQVGRPSPSLPDAVRKVADLAWRSSHDTRPSRVTPESGETAASSPSTTERSRRRPASIGELPAEVDVADLRSSVIVDSYPWRLPVGIGDSTLGPVGLTLYEGEHAIVAGPPRSGRTTALCSLAQVAAGGSARITIVAVASSRSSLATCDFVDQVLGPDAQRRALEEDVADLPGPVLLLVDDADLVADDHAAILGLLERRRDDVHVVAAARAEALRGLYAHWTRHLRASRTGVLLQPDPDLDGDLLGVRLPRSLSARTRPGLGYLVADGQVELLQVARRTT